MKQINLLKKTLLLVVATLVGGTMHAIDIPQADAGTYIPIGTVPATSGDKTPASGVTLTGCQVDGDHKSEAYTSYTVGSTNGSPMSIQFALTVADADAGNYLFSFKSGHSQGTATVSLSLKNSSNEEIWNNNGDNVNISNTGAWTPTEVHTFFLGDLEAGNYTMTITGVSTSSGTSFHGNFGNFCFHNGTSLSMPYDESHLLNVNMGTASGAKLAGNYLTDIQVNGYVDDVYMYVPQEGFYTVYAGYGYATAGTDNFTITITDVATSTPEVNAKNYTVTDSKKYIMTDMISAGWKKLRLDHPGPTITTSFRLEKMYFTRMSDLPMMGATTTYLDLSSGTHSKADGAKYNHVPSYESGNNNMGYNGDGGISEFVIANLNKTAYYDFHIGTYRYQNDATFTLTITDYVSGTTEVTESNLDVPSGSSYADAKYKITAAITPGIKTIRIASHSSTNTYIWNYKNVTFYKRSLNEAYNYTPVAATDVDVVLTRSIKAGNWSTIVLPFDIASSDITTIFGAGASVAELSSGTENTLNFSTTLTDSKMKANQPYAIKVPSDFTTATINGVTIVNATPTQSITNWDFVGTYSSTSVPTGSYYFKSNQLYQRGAGGTTTLKPFRAYLTYTGVTPAPSLNFVIDGNVTGIAHISADGQMHLEEGAVYNLSGQRVAQPTKGLYIVNGKKVIIK